jgi:non-canonical poly(A) RNA polymerase PAPD5/7
VGADVAETSLDSTYPPSKAKRNRYLNDLLRLCRQLKQNRDFEHCNILYARYPLIQMRHRVSGTDIQIVLSNDTSLARSTVASYVEQYPYLQELYSVIKTMFDVRGLSDVLRGGFGSYPIFMMIVASLQHSPPERQDAAGALLNFLRFWHSHDTTNYGISINPTTLFEKNTETVMSKVTQRKLKVRPLTRTWCQCVINMYQSKQSTTQPNLGFMLCLRDPADPTNDLGRKGTSIKHVQATCKYLEQQITSSLDDPASLEGPILNSVVGPIFNLNLARRKRLEFYGNQAMPSVQTNLAAKAKNIFRAAWKGGEKEAAKEAQAVSNAAYSAHDDKLASLITMPTAREIAARQVQSNKADKETIAEQSSETDTTAQRVQRTISTSEESEESQAQYHQ